MNSNDSKKEDIEQWVTRCHPFEENLEISERFVENLRPNSFSEYVGQNEIKENLQIACSAAKARGESIDHILFHGPPGLGKTSFARIISHELGVGFKATSGPVVERPGDLAAILTSMGEREVLFIDEIHRLSRVVEEVLYSAMEDFQIDILIGSGPTAKSIKIDLKPFTLIGATTRTGLLTSPLRDRFGMVLRLGFYSSSELSEIVKRTSRILNVKISDQACFEVGKRSRGTPRIANRLLKRIRDFAQERADGDIDIDTAKKALNLLNIDECGLDNMDRLILSTIIEKFDGGPVGIDTIAASIGEDKDTVEDVYEPYLLQEGFIARTRRGREATEASYTHLGLSPRISKQEKLFL